MSNFHCKQPGACHCCKPPQLSETMVFLGPQSKIDLNSIKHDMQNFIVTLVDDFLYSIMTMDEDLGAILHPLRQSRSGRSGHLW